MIPLVSCIMPTRGRPQMAAEAVQCYLSQTWPNKEMVILDDNDRPSFAADPGIPTIRYERANRLTIGAKRNLLCSRAQGDIICHFDDDDYSAPGRIWDQANRLLETGLGITGYSEMDFRAADGKVWRYIGRSGYALGTSLMYTRDFWRAHPFPDQNVSEDNYVVLRSKIASLPAGDMMYARIHAGNTSVKPNRETQNWKLVS